METLNTIPKQLPVNPDYVICYTPGKVGSTTIMRTVATAGIPCHRCNDSNIGQYHRKDYPTITAVRDPIAWAISTIFERAMTEGTVPKPEDAPRVVEMLMESTKQGLIKDYCDWLDNKYREVTGVSVYGRRFIKRHYYEIFSIRSLVIRTDKMDEYLVPALQNFLPIYYPEKDLSQLKTEHSARGVERFEGYDEFIDAVKFDKYWIAHFYDKNKFSRNFFFAEELKEWIKKWSKSR